MVVVHQVVMKFKPGVTPEQIEEVISTSVAMKHECVHENTQKPYIKSVQAGMNLNLVPNKAGFTHALLYQFETLEDCKYFIEKDPKHHEARRFRDRIEDVVLVDWTPLQ